MRAVYFDHAATTAVDERVLGGDAALLQRAIRQRLRAPHLGQTARAAVEQARQQVAAALGASEKEIIFTSGGTEATTWR